MCRSCRHSLETNAPVSIDKGDPRKIDYALLRTVEPILRQRDRRKGSTGPLRFLRFDKGVHGSRFGKGYTMRSNPGAGQEGDAG